MLLTEFPNIHWLKRQIRHQFQTPEGVNGMHLPFAGWPTVLLNSTTSKAFREDIEGPFSIFMNLKGLSSIRANRKQVDISNNAYVVTNDKEHYDLIINQEVPTETFNIHFGTQFMREASYWFQHNTAFLLEHPQAPFSSTIPSIELKATWRSTSFNFLVQQLQLLYQNPKHSTEVRETILLAIFEQVLLTQQKSIRQHQQLSSIKKSTKIELIKRLQLAVDYIYAYYHTNIQLEDLAQLSCLSKYHFLRSFKQVFGLAPYQFIKKIRLQQAIHLLQNSSASIQEIASTIGIENASSLSRMLFQLTGKYPSKYRK